MKCAWADSCRSKPEHRWSFPWAKDVYLCNEHFQSVINLSWRSLNENT